MHVKVKINITWFVVSLTCTFPPVSKYFDSQGMAASRAAHLPHILKGFTASDSGSTAKCRVPACILRPESIYLDN